MSDKSKLHARDRYLVTEVDEPWCFIKKFSGSQLRASSYKVKLCECFVVPSQPSYLDISTTHGDDEVCEEPAPDPPQPPTDLTRPLSANPDLALPSTPCHDESGEDVLNDSEVPAAPKDVSEPVPPFHNDEWRTQPTAARPQRSRKPPVYLKDYVLY